MFRLIKYTANAYSRYKMIPIVLVVATKSRASSFKEKFTICPGGSLQEASSDFWAKRFVLLTADAISEHFNEARIDPMAALGSFLTRHSHRQIPERHRSNELIQIVYSIVNRSCLKTKKKPKKQALLTNSVVQSSSASSVQQSTVEARRLAYLGGRYDSSTLNSSA